MDDNLNFFGEYYKLFCEIDEQPKNQYLFDDNKEENLLYDPDKEKLSLAFKAASKCIGFDIPPLRKEDMAEELQKIVGRGIEKIYNKTHKKSPKVKIDMKDNLETTMTIHDTF